MGQTKLVNSVTRVVKILDLLSEGVNRLEDIYPRLGLSKSTAHRFLKSLVNSGLAVQNPGNRHYYLGPMLVKLASNPLISHKIIKLCALEEMRRLRDLSGESVLIIVPCGAERLVVKELVSPQKISLSWGDGSSVPIYAGSSGKLLLSEMDDKERELILRNVGFRKLAPNTITDPDRLREECAEIREQGYSLSKGEAQPGAAGMSVPVRNYICPVALCLLGPDFRFSPMDFLEEMKESAGRISEKLRLLWAETELKLLEKAGEKSTFSI